MFFNEADLKSVDGVVQNRVENSVGDEHFRFVLLGLIVRPFVLLFAKFSVEYRVEEFESPLLVPLRSSRDN